MKIKTSELTGLALDWAVCIALGHKVFPDGRLNVGRFGPLFGPYKRHPAIGLVKANPSTNWSQGGPIIEREWIVLNNMPFDTPPYWTAHIASRSSNERMGAWAHTPLIAAMRCFVASKLGDEVDVPKELLT
jgi:hypothetical protein